jgi:hypothetical protein
MITHPDINYKKEFHKLIRELSMMESICKRDRCPLARQCCVMCKLLKDKLGNVKLNLMHSGTWEEDYNGDQ